MKTGKRIKSRKPEKGNARPLHKVATNVRGLDEVLEGGLPAGRTTLVSGGPGCGKSILGMEFICRGAQAGDPGIYVTFEEQANAIRDNAKTMGWDLEALEREGLLFLMDARVDPQMVISGDFNLKSLLAIIDGKAKAMGAGRIVLDALDVLLRLFDDPGRERNELYGLHSWLNDRGLTAIMTVKASREKDASARYEFLDFMADCLIQLDQRVVGQQATRRARVVKYRGSGFGSNEYPFVISDKGFCVIPISTSELDHRPLGAPFSSGHARLDAVLGGGFRKASSILVSGLAGTGKTTLACTFVRAACGRGEKVLYIGFEESREALTNSMLSPGIDLRPSMKAGLLQFVTALPESKGAEEHLAVALDSVESFQPDHVVVDAISACRRMGREQEAFEYVMRLVNACKKRGLTCMLINQSEGSQDAFAISGIGISSIIDTIVFLRYVENRGEINRILLVLKARGSKHSNQQREFLITDKGIDIVDVYMGEEGVMTGTSRQVQESRDELDRRKKLLDIKLQDREVARRRAALETQRAVMEAELEAAKMELERLTTESGIRKDMLNERGKMRGETSDSSRLKSSTPAKRAARKSKATRRRVK